VVYLLCQWTESSRPVTAVIDPINRNNKLLYRSFIYVELILLKFDKMFYISEQNYNIK
jgi:hypothetical protein